MIWSNTILGKLAGLIFKALQVVVKPLFFIIRFILKWTGILRLSRFFGKNYRWGAALFTLLVIALGYGHNLFDSDNAILGVWGHIGDIESYQDEDKTVLFWNIHDAEKELLKAVVLIATAILLLSRKLNIGYRVGFAFQFLLISGSCVWDALQVLVWNDSDKYAGIEIAFIVGSVVVGMATVEVIPMPRRLKDHFKKLNQDFAIVINDFGTIAYKAKAVVSRLFGKKTEKMITFQKLSSDIQAAEIENEMLKEMLDNKEPISDEELRKIMTAIHDNSNDIQNWLVMWGAGHNEKAKDAIANIAMKITEWSDRSVKKIDQKTGE